MKHLKFLLGTVCSCLFIASMVGCPGGVGNVERVAPADMNMPPAATDNTLEHGTDGSGVGLDPIK